MRACSSRLETIPRPEYKKGSLAFLYAVSRAFFSPHDYTVARYYDARMERRVRELLADGSYDILLCDFLQTTLNVISVDFRPRIVFQHNVEAVVRKRQYRQARNPITKSYLYLEWYKRWRYEKYVSNAFDHNIMVSETDRRIVATEYGAHNASAIPTAVDSQFFAPRRPDVDGNHIVFTGSMDWLPNQDGITWFVQDVLPRITSKVGATLWIVGRNPTRKIRRLSQRNSNVEVTGTVDDVRPYIARASVYVVPLRVGSGTRIKIFEAMAMEKAVVSTSIGAEGLPVTSGENIVLADEPQAFAEAVVQLIKLPSMRSGLGQRARRMVRENYTWEVAARRFSAICQEAAARATQPAY